VGSRYVPGASIEKGWGVLRFLNSFGATCLSRPLTSLKDPLSGFFAFRKQSVNIASLNPIGYKILLELVVKSNFKTIREVPIHFSDRKQGESKCSIKEQWHYLTHLRRLFLYKYPETSVLFQFLVVGAFGVFVNLTVLTALLALRIPLVTSIIFAVVASLLSNFLLNRRWTFSYARQGPWLRQFLGFTASCGLGAFVNFAVTLYLTTAFAWFPQVSALVGIALGTGINYLCTRFFVFRKTRSRS